MQKQKEKSGGGNVTAKHVFITKVRAQCCYPQNCFGANLFAYSPSWARYRLLATCYVYLVYTRIYIQSWFPLIFPVVCCCCRRCCFCFSWFIPLQQKIWFVFACWARSRLSPAACNNVGIYMFRQNLPCHKSSSFSNGAIFCIPWLTSYYFWECGLLERSTSTWRRTHILPHVLWMANVTQQKQMGVVFRKVTPAAMLWRFFMARGPPSGFRRPGKWLS